MMKYKYLFVIILLLVLHSCSINNNEENEIFIDIENKTDSISFYEYFKGVSIIPLETNETCLIQEVTRKIYSDSTYYIFDEPQKCVFAFNSKGKYKFKIRNIGKGPGEYTKIVDFDINEYQNSIDILSQTGKILQYDKNGTFIGSYNLPNSINAVHYFKSISKDTIALYQMFEQEKVFFYSISKKKVFNIQHELPDYLYRHLPISNKNSPFQLIRGELRLFEPFSNNIYTLKNELFIPKYMWNFGKYNFDITSVDPNRDGKFYQKYFEDNDCIHLFVSYTENNSMVITQFKYQKYMYSLVYLKKNRNYVILDKFKEGVLYPLYPVNLNDGLFITAEPSHVKYYINSDILNSKTSNFPLEVKAQDNPVIIKYKFK